jgi:catechol 2,3-dioxygenase-like lactoylglutathione lyase family enzyme
MIQGLYGVLIKTANLDKLKKFYTEKLGLQAHHSCAGCATLKLTDTQWVTLQKNPGVKVDLGEQAPVAMAFQVADIEGLHKKLSKQGVKFSFPPKDEDWGASVATTLDPDGNRIVFIQEKSGAAKSKERCAAMKEGEQ